MVYPALRGFRDIKRMLKVWEIQKYTFSVQPFIQNCIMILHPFLSECLCFSIKVLDFTQFCEDG